MIARIGNIYIQVGIDYDPAAPVPALPAEIELGIPATAVGKTCRPITRQRTDYPRERIIENTRADSAVFPDLHDHITGTAFCRHHRHDLPDIGIYHSQPMAIDEDRYLCSVHGEITTGDQHLRSNTTRSGRETVYKDGRRRIMADA